MQKQAPKLVIMAAGMGSRFGGLKQITPVGDNGEIIMDFSLYDAYQAGFRKVVFVIKKEREADFRAIVGSHVESRMDVQYVFQSPDDVPEWFTVPEGREKPWGTAHAVRACRNVIDGPFAVINADDFYGAGAFRALYDFLAEPMAESENAMVGYRMRNTVTENGYVARGVCETANGFLTSITERTHIEKRGDHAAYTTDGETYIDLPGDTLVSMNFWGFMPSIFDELETYFYDFLRSPEGQTAKAECLLPNLVGHLLEQGRLTVSVLESEDRWFGMTYHEDRARVAQALSKLHETGAYPEELR